MSFPHTTEGSIPVPACEQERLELLSHCRILDTPAEPDFDDLTRLAAQICGTPIALISLVTEARQWFKARVGLKITETPRQIAFCAHAIVNPGEVLVIPDAAQDERFAQNDLVLGEPRIRFYAGAPLVMEEGVALGTLCVIDVKPRTLTDEQVEALRMLSRQVVSQVQLRRQTHVLRVAQEEQERFFARPLDMFAVADLAGNFITVNAAFREVLGYEPDELRGVNVFTLVHTENLPEAMQVMARLLSGIPVANFECRVRTKAGNYRWLGMRAAPPENGRLYASARDVTRQREMQERLKKVMRMQRAMLDNAAHAFISSTPDGVVSVFNKAAERMLGWSEEEVVGKVTPAVWHDGEEVATRARQYSEELGVTIEPGFEVFAAKARRRLRNEDEWTFIRRDGSRLIVQLSVTALWQDDVVVGFIGIAVDITERKRTEARIIASERRFRDAIDHSAIGMALVGLDGSWLKVNRALCAILGRSEEELLRSTFQQITHPDDLDADAFNTNELLCGRTDHFQMEKRYLHKMGHVIWALLAVTIVRDAAGQPAYFVSQIKDITERREAHERLRTSLAEKNALIQEVHHRVKNNLQVISSLLSLQAGYIEDPTTLAHFRESQDRIRSMALIHEMLYRSETLSCVDLREYVESLSRMIVNAYAGAGRLKLELELDAVNSTIDIAVPLGLLLNELLTNTVKYAFPAGRTGRVALSLRSGEQGAFNFCLEDDGVGLPEGFRVKNARTLGLRLVAMFVKQLGAELVESSAPGCTRFAVSVPTRRTRPRPIDLTPVPAARAW